MKNGLGGRAPLKQESLLLDFREMVDVNIRRHHALDVGFPVGRNNRIYIFVFVGGLEGALLGISKEIVEIVVSRRVGGIPCTRSNSFPVGSINRLIV